MCCEEAYQDPVSLHGEVDPVAVALELGMPLADNDDITKTDFPFPHSSTIPSRQRTLG